MTNGQINLRFLAKVPVQVKWSILQNIAHNYGISSDDAYAEVCCDAAEQLLDYTIGSVRAATMIYMAKYK